MAPLVEVSPNMITQWKRQASEGLAEVLSGKVGRGEAKADPGVVRYPARPRSDDGFSDVGRQPHPLHGVQWANSQSKAHCKAQKRKLPSCAHQGFSSGSKMRLAR